MYLLTFVFIQVIIILDLANLILQTYSAEINDSTKFWVSCLQNYDIVLWIISGQKGDERNEKKHIEDKY